MENLCQNPTIKTYNLPHDKMMTI